MKDIEKESMVHIALAHMESGVATLEEIKLVRDTICKHFGMIQHMKNTSLYDVYEYEEKLAQTTIEPMKILLYENEKLKREVNHLRTRLGKIEKYRIMEDEI